MCAETRRLLEAWRAIDQIQRDTEDWLAPMGELERVGYRGALGQCRRALAAEQMEVVLRADGLPLIAVLFTQAEVWGLRIDFDAAHDIGLVAA